MLNYNLDIVTNQSFAALMSIGPLTLPNTPPGIQLYQSTSKPFQPMPGFSGVFGGHVLAQAVVAGAETVGEKHVCHSLHAYFLQRGDPLIPFIYAVETLRNGGRYKTRSIRVYQIQQEKQDEFEFSNKYMCFTAMLSFKVPEEGLWDWSAPYPEKYARPDHEIIQMEVANDYDAPVILDLAHRNGMEPQWHSIDCRKMDSREDNMTIPELSDRRIIHYFRSPFKLPNRYNMHVALLLYISDRNSLFTLVNIQKDPWVNVMQLASIDHQFVLHRLNPIVDDDYLMMETWSDSAADSRGLYNGRMFDSNKNLIASFMQDGVIRVAPSTKL